MPKSRRPRKVNSRLAVVAETKGQCNPALSFFIRMIIGDYRFEVVPDTEFRLDGGAMFGVVPRVVWERVCPPDELNRIRMNMNCAFIDTGKEKILIETGIGEKWSEKQTKMYGIFRERPLAETLLEKAGCVPGDITIVVNTHLHFDHAGGNTIFDEGGETAVPQFPNARYLVSRAELEHAESPHERDRASYIPNNWRPMQETGQLELMPDSYEVVDGLTIQQVRGHSETMQTWKLSRGGETIYGFADLIPMRQHLPLAWVAGFDLYPTETLAFKKQVLPLAVDERWLALFYHDLDRPLCRLAQDNDKIAAIPI
jgi:glyoxylase-like metal-dependent hydrolase (beta-lactamase superfamily II)